MSEEKTIIAYKGFDMQMQCRGYQFEIGKTYKHDGHVEACSSGFHSCENPLDIFRYYEPSISLFAEVEAAGEISHHADDSKIASGRLSIRAHITIPDIVTKAIAWIASRCDEKKGNHVTGDQSASSATGKSSVAMNIGVGGKARADEGGAIVLCEHDNDGNLLNIRCSKVGQHGIEANTFYTLVNNEFLEVSP